MPSKGKGKQGKGGAGKGKKGKTPRGSIAVSMAPPPAKKGKTKTLPLTGDPRLDYFVHDDDTTYRYSGSDVGGDGKAFGV